jgi:hypothetical protein
MLIMPLGKIPGYPQQENEEICRRAATVFPAVLTSSRKNPALLLVVIFRTQRESFGELKEHVPVDYQYWKERR